LSSSNSKHTTNIGHILESIVDKETHDCDVVLQILLSSSYTIDKMRVFVLQPCQIPGRLWNNKRFILPMGCRIDGVWVYFMGRIDGVWVNRAMYFANYKPGANPKRIWQNTCQPVLRRDLSISARMGFLSS